MARAGRSRTLLGVLAAGAFALAACRRERPAAVLRIAHETEVMTLDPYGPPDSATKSVLANFYESLVAFDRDMVLVPQLAEAWETQDATTWVLRLRPGVTFHDGTPLGAREVRLALDHARSEASGVKGTLANVRSVDEVGALAVRIVTSRPDPLLVNRLALVPIARAAGGGFAGTGPYRPLAPRKGAPLEAEAFPKWWGGKPAFGRVLFVTVPSGRDVLEAMKGGGVDVLRFVPENLVAEARKVPGARVEQRTGLTAAYLWFDARPGGRNPFADARVRRAVSLAVDRPALVAALSGNALALDQAVPRGIFGHAPLPPARHDPAEARRLVTQAGWPQGFDAALTHSPGATSEAVANALRPMLAEAGIRLALRAPTWKEMEPAWRGARLPFFAASWRFDMGDASSFLEECLVTRDEASGKGIYNPGYSNPALDRLVEEGEHAVEAGKRLALYEQAARLVDADVPVVPLYHRFALYALSDRVAWKPRLDGRILACEVTARQPR